MVTEDEHLRRTLGIATLMGIASVLFLMMIGAALTGLVPWAFAWVVGACSVGSSLLGAHGVYRSARRKCSGRYQLAQVVVLGLTVLLVAIGFLAWMAASPIPHPVTG